MDNKDLLTFFAAIAIVIVFALIVHPPLDNNNNNNNVTLSPSVQSAPIFNNTSIVNCTVLGEKPVNSVLSGYWVQNYRWTCHDGGLVSWKISIPKELFNDYRSKPRSKSAEDYSQYSISEDDRKFLSGLINNKFRVNVADAEYNEYYTVMDVISFVQQIDYTHDSNTLSYIEGEFPEQYHEGHDYPKYPIETLVDKTGDCEDMSILTAALLDEMDYDVVLLLFPPTKTGKEGHMAVGVNCIGSYSGKKYSYDGKDYYFLETTAVRGIDIPTDERIEKAILTEDGWKEGWVTDDYGNYVNQDGEILINPNVIGQMWGTIGEEFGNVQPRIIPIK